MFIKYPSIDSYKNAVKEINRTIGIESFPSIPMTGTVKIHGTNGGVVVTSDGDVMAQSRNRALTLDSDNAGFASFVEFNRDHFLSAAQNTIGFNNYPIVVIYGEWCGGNIQAGVGVNGMPRTFVVFDVYLTDGEDGVFVDQLGSFRDHDRRVYSIMDFKNWLMEVDFSSQDDVETLNRLTLKVEQECPVAASLNPGSECMVGEGIVWRGEYKGKRIVFKHKGEKHQRGGGSKSIKASVSYSPEQQSAIDSFCQIALTEDRLLQGIEYLNEMGFDASVKSTGQFIGWVMKDINKECANEIAELGEGAGVEWKPLANRLSKTVREWYFERI